MTTGEKIINLIIATPLVNVECPDSPGSTCVVKWAANVVDQIDAMVASNDTAKRETLMLCRAILLELKYDESADVIRCIDSALQ